jgi:GntR family transcriptional repressor for pyruvate dehydrogenase complex
MSREAPAPVRNDAIASIRRRISSGEWGPGTRLPREADLAGELGVSRGSLREAVSGLALARVLDVRQGDGTYVSSLDAYDLLEPVRSATSLMRGQAVLDLFAVRRILEPEAAAITARSADDGVRRGLRAELERMHAAGDRVDLLLEADNAFHELIARAPGNPVLHSLLGSLSMSTAQARAWHGMADRSVLDETRAEHESICAAIEAGDAELARAATTIHIATNERWLRANA